MSIIKSYKLDENFKSDNILNDYSTNIIKSSKVISLSDVVVYAGQKTTEAVDERLSDDMDELLDIEEQAIDVDIKPVAKAQQPVPTPVDESKIRRELENSLKGNVDELLQAVSNLQKSRDEILKASEDQLTDLAISIAEKVISREVTLDPNVIKAIVSDTFDKISGSDKVLFKVSPSDVDTFDEFRPYIESQLIGIKNIDIQPDPSIDQGGCIIESGLGFIDITVKEKLNIITQTFNKIKSSL